MKQGFDEAVRLIRAGQNFLLTCHVLPDADAVGSMLGLAEVLKALGKNVVLYNRDPVPDMVTFLPGVEEIRQSIPAGDAFRRDLDHRHGGALAACRAACLRRRSRARG